jgi:adenylate kinase family enzyme
VEYYKKKEVYHAVDGTVDVETVFDSIRSILE